MPSADSPIRDGLALRFAHSLVCLLPRPLFVFHSGSSMDRTRCPINAWDFVSPVFPVFRLIYSDSSLRDVGGLPG